MTNVECNIIRWVQGPVNFMVKISLQPNFNPEWAHLISFNCIKLMTNICDYSISKHTRNKDYYQFKKIRCIHLLGKVLKDHQKCKTMKKAIN